ncbi:MAG: hemerythrin domain-containing protein, partial [Acidimicrobiales bacterium]
ADLIPHMTKEESVVFPAIRTLAGHGESPGDLAVPIAVMTAEHEHSGDALTHLRSATSGYHAPSDVCLSFTSLYHRLGRLDADTRRHIFEENAFLFPAALDMQATVQTGKPEQ